ncbi:MAG TPA: VacJ family lipoprotein [Pseudomonadales bacterium]
MLSCRMSRKRYFWALGTMLLVSMSAMAEPADEKSIDPWEPMNRGIFRFNDTLDRYTLKPLAEGYRWITPDPVERGVNNVFRNLQEIRNLINQLLQGKPIEAASDTARFLVNSTVGIVGIFDVASHIGLERHEEDFGQTLAVWGVPQGPYLVLPFFGPSSPRGAVGFTMDVYVHPLNEVDDVRVRNSLTALDLASRRADLLKVEDVIFGDRYIFIRDAYLQQRQALINDGNTEDDEFVDEFGGDFDETF